MKSDEESDVSYESGIDASDSKEGLNVNNVMLDETVSPAASEILANDFIEGFNDELFLNKLSQREFTVFLLSEVGKPIYASCGHEEELCSLTALIQTFVMVAESWEDSLINMCSGNLYIAFSHRGPLIICIIVRDNCLLDTHIDLVYKQVLSVLCRVQLLSIFDLKGPSFDLRILLRGMDRLISEILYYYRSDVTFFQKSVRVFPMPLAEREFIANTISNCVNNTKPLNFLIDPFVPFLCTSLSSSSLSVGEYPYLIVLKLYDKLLKRIFPVTNVILGIVIVHRQLVAMVRMNGVQLHPFDLHIIINLVECNPSIKNAHNWIPICLPHFNDAGFVHAYITYFAEESPACLILISLERNAFEPLRMAVDSILTKLKASKSYTVLESLFTNPLDFEIDTALFPDLWHFILKKNSVSQVCSSLSHVPYTSKEERRRLQKCYRKIADFCSRANLQEIFIKSPENCIYVNVCLQSLH
ncbi:unnamed protein product [Dracunculus medinensis]|uniref:Vacuolar fusion protein MON1 homolog n=1 Tax=Dracunculus medinensis TaxID=318479 RepID=A0A0N4UHB2_DRAME|nr:unnamed protein product [Dracunculus medinensis]